MTHSDFFKKRKKKKKNCFKKRRVLIAKFVKRNTPLMVRRSQLVYSDIHYITLNNTNHQATGINVYENMQSC